MQPTFGVFWLEIDGTRINASSVRELFDRLIEYLVRTEKINRISIPYPTSSKRYLLSKDPKHQGGNDFRIPSNYDGYYMEAHKNRKEAVVQVTNMLKRFGIICIPGGDLGTGNYTDL